MKILQSLFNGHLWFLKMLNDYNLCIKLSAFLTK